MVRPRLPEPPATATVTILDLVAGIEGKDIKLWSLAEVFSKWNSSVRIEMLYYLPLKLAAHIHLYVRLDCRSCLEPWELQRPPS